MLHVLGIFSDGYAHFVNTSMYLFAIFSVIHLGKFVSCQYDVYNRVCINGYFPRGVLAIYW